MPATRTEKLTIKHATSPSPLETGMYIPHATAIASFIRIVDCDMYYPTTSALRSQFRTQVGKVGGSDGMEIERPGLTALILDSGLHHISGPCMILRARYQPVKWPHTKMFVRRSEGRLVQVGRILL
jgi:hypothetical protein